MDYRPKTPEMAEAFDYGYGKGIVHTLLDLHDEYPEIANSAIWQENIVMAGILMLPVLRAEGLADEARQRAVETPPTAPELYSVSGPNSGLAEQAIDFAKKQIGKRYVSGGFGPDVWDCSGIAMKAYASAGVDIGQHSATAQYNIMAKQQKLVPFQDAQRGDLIWWSRSSAFDGDKYHVAIYLGDGMILEAPHPARTVQIVPVRYGELWPYAGRPTATGLRKENGSRGED